MSLWDKWFRLDKRAIDASQFNRGIFDVEQVHAGVTVSQDSALKFVAVYACVRLLSETLASLPVDTLRNSGDSRLPVPRPRWLSKPNMETGWFNFIEQTMASLLLDGNAYLFVTNTDNNGLPTDIDVAHPADVLPKREGNRLVYEWNQKEYLSLIHISEPTRPY